MKTAPAGGSDTRADPSPDRAHGRVRPLTRLSHFVAEILAENRPMLTLARRLGDTETTRHGSTVSARIDLTAATEQARTSGYDCHDLLRAAARGEFIGLPAMLQGWLDLSQKIIATIRVPVSAFCDTPRQAAPTATAPEPPEDPRPSPAGCRLDVTN